MASEVNMEALTSMPIEDLATDFLALLARLRAAEAEVERVREYLTAAADEARDRAKTAERERDEAWSDLHLVAEAAGAMHDQSIGPSYPGTAEEVTAAIQTLRRERDEARAEIDKLHAITLDVMRERDEARAALIRAQEDHRAAVEALETYEERIGDIADHVLGLVPPDVPSIVKLDAIERRCGEERVAARQAEARVRALRAVRDAAEAYVAAIDSAVDNPADFLGSIEREKQALVNIRAALRAAARGT